MGEALTTWRNKLAYLQQEEAIVVDSEQKFNLAERIKEAKSKIAELEVTAGPSDDASAFHADISRIIKYAPAELIGREAETKLLSDAWDKAVRGETKRLHILTFVALGGEGKTSLVAKWAADLAHQEWPGCDMVLAWSFYHQGTDEKTADSSDLFLKHALTAFGDTAMAGSAQGAFDKGRRLAQLVGERRALLILDGLEPLQYAPTSPTPGELKDQGLAALLRGLAATSHGLCVVTTRYAVPDLRAFLGKTVQEEKLTSLSKETGVALLRFLGVKGALSEFETLVEDVHGHALTLNLLGSYLRDCHAGDIRRRDLVRLEEADAEEQGGHAFRVMDAYVQAFENGGKTAEDKARGRRSLALLELLGLFDRPAQADCLDALWKGDSIAGLTEPLIDLGEAQRNLSLTRLENAKLLTVKREEPSGVLIALDAHPLLREYFARRLRRQQPEAWRGAHQRLYAHLCKTTSDKKQNPTLEDLQPLYQAVAHGCHAGLQQQACDEVYRDRILRGTSRGGFYSMKKLGAVGADLGAIACFFESPWNQISATLSVYAQSWILGEAANRLRALGRLIEALQPTRVTLLGAKKAAEDATDAALRVHQWKQAANGANNLSELELTLGDVAGALGNAEQSVTFADRANNLFISLYTRTTHADALHQANRRVEAKARFLEAEGLQREGEARLREAESPQAKSQPHYPFLSSVQGFRYCDLLLSAPERAAWQVTLHSSVIPSRSSLSDSCREVSARAVQTLNIAERNNWLLDVALDQLTLGIVALYAAILHGRLGSTPSNADSLEASWRTKDTAPELAIIRPELDAAVASLRRAGMQFHTPRGLLARAWFRSLKGRHTGPASAQSDLDESWEIAERGPMPLFLADIHLHRARLFFRESSYPWKSPQADLAEARRLIEKHGYWRRKEELEDAEAVINDPWLPPAS